VKHYTNYVISALKVLAVIFNRMGSEEEPRHRHGQDHWDFLCKFWSGWRNAPIAAKPEIVVVWHCAGFRLFRRFRSPTQKPGRPQITAEIRSAIGKMKPENATWSAPGIHGEPLKLEIGISCLPVMKSPSRCRVNFR
jgi:hypothetical protein